MTDSLLIRLLRERLSPDVLEALRHVEQKPSPESYEPVLRGVRTALPRLREQVVRTEGRIAELLDGVADIPPERLRMLTENGPPHLLAALARRCMTASWDERFESPARSLELAQGAVDAARAVRDRGLLDAAAQADLEGEAWLYLANARRISSDFPGAEQGLVAADELLERGTGDREIAGKRLQAEAFLRFSQGLAERAAALFDREIAIRRRLEEEDPLGRALINRGIVAAWSETLETACGFFAEGAALTEDLDSLLLTLNPIAERLARDGQGLIAWRVIRQIEAALAIGGGESHALRMRWVKGLTYRALGDLEAAAVELKAVRERLIADELVFRAALAALDLAAVYAAQGRSREVIELADEAYAVFLAERLERRALAAVLLLRRTAEAQTLTEALAVRVANFLARSRYDKSAAFEAPTEP